MKTNNVELAMSRFGISALRPEQEKILPTILSGRDVCCVLRTGGGKSLLYQLPAMSGPLWDTTVVISPLVALQQDQVEGIDKRERAAMAKGSLGYKSTVLVNSSTSKSEREEALDRIRTCTVQLVYLAPEQLENRDTLDALSMANIVRVVVDEAHTLPTSAEGYRPTFGQIGVWIQTLPKRPQILTFSATMTAVDLCYVQKSLGMKSPKVYTFPVRRENLHVRMVRVGSAKGKQSKDTIEKVRRHGVELALTAWKQSQQGGSCIIYCTTVKQVKQLSKWLKARNWSVACYHGKQDTKKREKCLADFLSGKVEIVVATNAFGLGVDKPDVRLVIHASPPISLDGYVQEIGRAGRDGEMAECILLHASSDWKVCDQIVGYSGSKELAIKRLDALKALVRKGRFKWKIVEKYFSRR